jgi:hypothetical protein
MKHYYVYTDENEDEDELFFDETQFDFLEETDQFNETKKSEKKEKVEKPPVVFVVNNKPAPWANIKSNPVDFKKIVEETETKNDILWNNKNNTIKIETKPLNNVDDKIKHDLKKTNKTKFCLNVIETGKCLRKSCGFAHSLKELNFPSCLFGDNCKKNNCLYKHPCENDEEFKERTNFKIPKNIK